MYRLICTAIIGTAAIGCERESTDITVPLVPTAESITESQAQMDLSEITGEAAYKLVCSSCHETGKNGAPVAGDAKTWSDRSPLWQAVLSEHANSGYMKMPAKGGDSELPDHVVNAATEHMMLLTYPNRPPD